MILMMIRIWFLDGKLGIHEPKEGRKERPQITAFITGISLSLTPMSNYFELSFLPH
jgi:hypothetical protein